MDILDKTYYFDALERLERGEGDAESLRALALTLARSCSPYLGYHDKVEMAFKRFVERTRTRDAMKGDAK